MLNRRDLEDLLFVDREFLAYELLWNWVRTLSRRLRATNDKMTFLATTSKFLAPVRAPIVAVIVALALAVAQRGTPSRCRRSASAACSARSAAPAPTPVTWASARSSARLRRVATDVDRSDDRHRALRWSTIFGYLFDSDAAALIDDRLRTVQMDFTVGARVRPGRTGRYLTARVGAELFRVNEPVPPANQRAYFGPIGSVGLDQYAFGAALFSVDVRYAPGINMPSSISLVFGFGLSL